MVCKLLKTTVCNILLFMMKHYTVKIIEMSKIHTYKSIIAVRYCGLAFVSSHLIIILTSYTEFIHMSTTLNLSQKIILFSNTMTQDVHTSYILTIILSLSLDTSTVLWPLIVCYCIKFYIMAFKEGTFIYIDSVFLV